VGFTGVSQTAATATVSGIVRVQAEQLCRSKSRLLTKGQFGADSGDQLHRQYIFANVLPGNDAVTVTMKGLVQVEVQLSVEVAKSYNINVPESGAATDAVEAMPSFRRCYPASAFQY